MSIIEKKEPFLYKMFPTPIGTLVTIGSNNDICLLEFDDSEVLESEFTKIQIYLKTTIIPGSNPLIEKLQFQVGEYFSGNLKQFDIPLLTPGSEFQKAVWGILQDIPYGQTMSYQEQAISLGSPKAYRAVAKANGSNRIAIVIPCHRVIAKNGQLTGYKGGLCRKTWLLNHEKLLYNQSDK
jgi:AraC family transcriptional regulator of adaptative response/methylated-DNA-[protein]-cysteine methyltransferase